MFSILENKQNFEETAVGFFLFRCYELIFFAKNGTLVYRTSRVKGSQPAEKIKRNVKKKV
jgi:hypothetical protein